MRRLPLLLAPAWLCACIAPSVVESSGRAVQVEHAALDWHPAEPAELSGLFESIAIEGEAAASLWRVQYHFSRNGSWTGAALVIGDAEPQFQTLSGSWTLERGNLDLGDGVPLRAEVAPEHMRLTFEGGSVVLRRAAVE